MLTNIFLDGAEFKTIRSMGASFSESEKKFINNIRRINEGEMSGFNTESSRIASLLNEKYLAKKEAGIIKAAAENLKYRTHSLSIGK
jgi:transcriptional regulator CtsR